MQHVFLNGEWLAPEDAHISVFDRGFLFGDGIYEVIPVYNGHLFRFSQHLTRLKSNISELKLVNPHSDPEWRAICQSLVDNNGGGNLSIYLQLTRGNTGVRAHALPDASVAPTVFATCSQLPSVPCSVLENGVKVTLLDDIRWQWCHIKSTSLLGNLMLANQAAEADAAEALLLRGGKVVEGATSNVFAVRDGVVITPPKSNHLLPGITRDLLIELISGSGIAIQERDLTADELANLDELWICSSTREIYPVTSVDDEIIADGKPGPVWAQCLKLFQEYKSRYQGDM